MTTHQLPKIALLLTGSELMSGDTIDSNSALIAQTLKPLGLTISRKTTLGDHPDALHQEIITLSHDHDILIINGGLGPTNDDLTSEVLARVTGHPLSIHTGAMKHLEQWAERIGIHQLNEANRKQAWLPSDCDIIPNPVGSAVGIQLQHNNCLILATPGVPSELKPMLNQSISPNLAERYALPNMPATRRWRLFGMGESRLQEAINHYLVKFIHEHPASTQMLDNIDIGFRASMPLLELKLIPKQEQLAEQFDPIESTMVQLSRGIESHFSDMIVGRDDESMQGILVNLLTQENKKLTTAESCTGGLIASRIAQVPGASSVFEAGFVTYANSIKEKILGVPQSILENEGAVSEACVRAMATGALAQSGADYVIAVSGIAGPSGGSQEKPVGTVWIAWGSTESIQSVKMVYKAPRKIFQSFIAAAGMDLIRRQLLGIKKSAHYLKHFS